MRLGWTDDVYLVCVLKEVANGACKFEGAMCTLCDCLLWRAHACMRDALKSRDNRVPETPQVQTTTCDAKYR